MIKRLNRSLILVWTLIGCSMQGCSDAGMSVEDIEPVLNYPVYMGEITVENRSQFEFTALYFHQTSRFNRVETSNLLMKPLEPGGAIVIEVSPSQYITAFRPRVEQGPLWKIQSDQAVSFYLEEGDPLPRLWILDQGFMVIDSLSKDQ